MEPYLIGGLVGAAVAGIPLLLWVAHLQCQRSKDWKELSDVRRDRDQEMFAAETAQAEVRKLSERCCAVTAERDKAVEAEKATAMRLSLARDTLERADGYATSIYGWAKELAETITEVLPPADEDDAKEQ